MNGSAGNFSLVEGGLLGGSKRLRSPGARIALFWAITWLPIALIESVIRIRTGAFPVPSALTNLAVETRLLLCIPLWVMAEPGIDRKVRAVLSNLEASGVVGEDRERFQSLLVRAARLARSRLPE